MNGILKIYKNSELVYSATNKKFVNKGLIIHEDKKPNKIEVLKCVEEQEKKEIDGIITLI